MSITTTRHVVAAVAIAALTGTMLGALFGDRLHVRTPCAPTPREGEGVGAPAAWVSNIGPHSTAENDALIAENDVRALAFVNGATVSR